MEPAMSIGKKLFLGYVGVIVATGGLIFFLPLVLRQFLDEGITVVVAVVLAAVAGMILAFVMAKSFTTEIRSLAAAARVVAEGDLTRDVPVNTADEVGELATAFNQMVGSVREIAREVKATAETVTSSAVVRTASSVPRTPMAEVIRTTVAVSVSVRGRPRTS
jgi:methyl-accepting chemotaxis protein